MASGRPTRRRLDRPRVARPRAQRTPRRRRPRRRVRTRLRLRTGHGQLRRHPRTRGTPLILRATELLEPEHGQDRATTIALALHVTYNAAATVASLVAGRHSDRTNAIRVLTAGVAAFAVAYLGFTQDTTHWTLLLPSFLLAGVGIGCVETAEHTAVATHAPTHIRGSAFGFLAATQSFGNLAASLVAGILWTAFSPSWAFAYLTSAMVVALVSLRLTARANRPRGG